MTRLIDQHPIIDDTLDAWSTALGTQRTAYMGHVYRVFNLARWFLASDRNDDALAVASAFHDIGIWSDRTFDYLAPSSRRARDYVARKTSEVSVDVVADAIENHHRLRAVRGPSGADVVEAFRRADLVDVSRGWFRLGIDRGFHRDVVTAFPYAGFHGILVRTALSWFLKHPFRPLPMVRL